MITPHLQRAREFLNSKNISLLAEDLVDNSPWFHEPMDSDFNAWGTQLLARCGLTRSALYLVGSGAIGFSLAPEKAGALFRPLGGPGRPSDLDFALVDESLYIDVWNEMLVNDRENRGRYIEQIHIEQVRLGVYWGRIDQYAIPRRYRAQLRRIIDAIRRSSHYRGYPATIRLYRRRVDLVGYTIWSLNNLKRALR